MRVGSLVFATEQGLGYLAKSFFDAGVVTDVMVVRHGRRPERGDWYLGSKRITNLADIDQQRVIADFCAEMDIMLFFETPFVWQIMDRCKQLGTKTILMPMYECEPKVLPAQPDLFLCPSLLDYQYYPLEITSDGPDEPLPAKITRKSVYLPVPVEVPWRQRGKAEVFVHNAGHGGLKGRNGTEGLVDAVKYITAPIHLIVRTQDQVGYAELRKRLATNVPAHTGMTYEWNLGGVPYESLYQEGDVFVFPEKFNGLSLPLQEARAAGMLVISTDRFPMNTWLPTEVVCPACDGEGSLMYQWAKEYSIKHGGSKKTLPDGSWYYVTGDGKEIGFKTIGGDCRVCLGKKINNPLIPKRGTRLNEVSPRCNSFEEAIVDPKDIAAKIDEWYGADITEYSLQGREWAEQNSWKVLRPKYLEVLENLCKSN